MLGRLALLGEEMVALIGDKVNLSTVSTVEGMKVDALVVVFGEVSSETLSEGGGGLGREREVEVEFKVEPAGNRRLLPPPAPAPPPPALPLATALDLNN